MNECYQDFWSCVHVANKLSQLESRGRTQKRDPDLWAASANTTSELALEYEEFIRSMWFMCTHSYVHRWACTYVCVCIHAFSSMEARGQCQVFLKIICWGRISHRTWSSPTLLDWLASSFQKSMYLHLPLRIHVQLLTWVWGPTHILTI